MKFLIGMVVLVFLISLSGCTGCQEKPLNEVDKAEMELDNR